MTRSDAYRNIRQRRRSPRQAQGARLFRPYLEALECRQMPSIYTVTTTADAGSGSLRQAILDANAHSGTNTIAFNIGGGGVQVIQPAMPLPALTVPILIDGTTQPDYSGVPLIELTGSAAGPDANGLSVQGGNSLVRGLIINGFAQAGIVLSGGGTNTVTANYIGTNTTGMTAVANGEGIRLSFSSNNVIGGTVAEAGNLIAGNLGSGIQVASNVLTRGNRIEGNYIGTNVTGTHTLGNRTGVELQEANNTIGGTGAGAGNLIAGNDIGVAISAAGNLVQGNSIGTDITGTTALGNRIGVLLENPLAENCLVGGSTAAARNLISGNAYAGVEITGPGTGGNTVAGNYIGTDITGA